MYILFNQQMNLRLQTALMPSTPRLALKMGSTSYTLVNTIASWRLCPVVEEVDGLLLHK